MNRITGEKGKEWEMGDKIYVNANISSDDFTTFCSFGLLDPSITTKIGNATLRLPIDGKPIPPP